MRSTLDSVIAQTIRPQKWVIVDDGSTDESPETLVKFASKHEWIGVITPEDRGRRAVGPSVLEAFYARFEAIEIDDYDFICNLQS